MKRVSKKKKVVARSISARKKLKKQESDAAYNAGFNAQIDSLQANLQKALDGAYSNRRRDLKQITADLLGGVPSAIKTLSTIQEVLNSGMLTGNDPRLQVSLWNLYTLGRDMLCEAIEDLVKAKTEEAQSHGPSVASTPGAIEIPLAEPRAPTMGTSA